MGCVGREGSRLAEGREEERKGKDKGRRQEQEHEKHRRLVVYDNNPFSDLSDC